MGSFRRRRPESLTGHAGDDQVLASLANVGDLSSPRLLDHGIVASRSDRAVTPEAVTEPRAFFEGLVATVAGGEYDGWGAEGD